jgi:hypothetical protein
VIFGLKTRKKIIAKAKAMESVASQVAESHSSPKAIVCRTNGSFPQPAELLVFWWALIRVIRDEG